MFLVSSGVPAASLSSALSAHFCCPLAHHSRLHGQVHACWLQRPSGEISDEHKNHLYRLERNAFGTTWDFFFINNVCLCVNDSLFRLRVSDIDDIRLGIIKMSPQSAFTERWVILCYSMHSIICSSKPVL